jgi:hypothetical protein
MHGLIYEQTKRGKIKTLRPFRISGGAENALRKMALSALRGEDLIHVGLKRVIISDIANENMIGRLQALLSAGDTVEDKQDTLYKQALIEVADHIDEGAQRLADYGSYTEGEHRAVKQRTAYLRALSAEIESAQPTTPREQLTETAREETRGADAPEIAQESEPQRFSDINREYQRRLAAARDKARQNLEQVKRRGGTKKQIAQARRKLRALGGTETVDTRAPDSEDPKPTAQSASPSGVTDSSGQLMSKRTLQEIVANIVETESKTKRLNIADLHGALYQRGVSIRPGQLKDLLSAASSRNIISLKPWTEGLDKVEYPEYLISRLQGNMMYHVEPANGPKRDLPDTPATVQLNGRPLSLAEVSQEVVRKLGSNATSIKDLEAGLRESGMDIETGHLHDHLNLLNEKGIVAFEEDRMHTRNPDATSSLVRRDEQGITRVYDKVRLAQ